MKSLRASAIAVSVLALSVVSPALNAHDKDDDNKVPARITVTFGTGNNNAQPGNTPNHHILPQEFTVRITKARRLNGDVVVVPASVNFIVSGFHWAWVYKDGVSLQEVAAAVPTAGPLPLFLNYEVIALGVSNVFAKGVFPGTPPTFTDAGPFPFSGTQNRTDSFAFSTPGRYLVICNVTGHFVDGMYAWINVVDDDHHDHDHHDH